MYRIDSEIFDIEQAQIRVLKPVPCTNAFQDSSMGPFMDFGIAMLTLEDTDGNKGEAPVFSSYSNILESCLLPILLNSRKARYPELFRRLYWSIRNEGFRGVAAAVLGQLDLALHDLAARRAGLSLHRYLGASRNEVKFYGSGGGTNYNLSMLEKEVDLFREMGTDCYKMKVGKNFGCSIKEDLDRVKYVRALLGDDVRLAVDANQIWTAGEVFDFVRDLGSTEIAWIEEPVHSAALDQIEKICGSIDLPVSYGESERSALVFPSLVRAGVRHLQPIPTQISGVQEWLQVFELARRNNLMFSSGGYSLITASLMAACEEDHYVEYLYPIMHGLEQYFAIKPCIRDGKFLLDDSLTGISIRIDWDYYERNDLIVKTQTWSARKLGSYLPTVII